MEANVLILIVGLVLALFACVLLTLVLLDMDDRIVRLERQSYTPENK